MGRGKQIISEQTSDGGHAVARPYTKNNGGFVGTAYWLSAKSQTIEQFSMPLPDAHISSPITNVFTDHNTGQQ